MSSPDQNPSDAAGQTGSSNEEVVDVRRGMFGVKGTGDTSGYGRLVREIVLPGSSPARTASTSTRSPIAWPRR